ncbi:MAG: fimbrillin family protein [Rikenellaceae bacterium]
MKRAITILASAAALLVGCDKSGDGLESAADGVARFSSDISTRVSTDSAGDSEWEAGDRVGIYMYDYMYDASSLVTLRENVQYSATAGATTEFSLASGEEAILYPNSGEVCFWAYAPYTDEEYLTLDVSDQTTEAKRNLMDYMFARATAGTSFADSATAVALTFEHQMAMLKFEVTCNESVTSLTGLTCAITGLTTTQSYDVERQNTTGTPETGTIDMLVEQTNDTTATITAIVHPGAVSSSSVVLSLGGKTLVATLPALSFSANKIYTYAMEMGSNYVTIGTGTVSAWGTLNDEGTLDLERVPVDLVYNGTEFEINSAAGLFAFADLVNGVEGSTATVDWGTGDIQAFSTTQQLGIDGVLTTDVNLGGSSSPWSAICSSGSYTGTFDGGGYLVSGLYISGSSNTQGLFGSVGSGGVVKNLGVSGEVSGTLYTGGVVGNNSSSSVTNCYWVDVAADNATAGLGNDTEDITEKTTKKTAAEMQAEDFAKLLNTNAKEITGACAWVDNSSTSGYPTLDFGVAAE